MTIGDLFKDDAQCCSEVAACLGHMTCWDCCLVLWICPEQMVLDPAQSFDDVYRNVTKLSGDLVHVSATFVLVRAVVFPWMKPKLAPNVRHVLNNSSSPN